MTSAGKIDRQALPAPDLSRPELEIGFIAPKTTVESVLANVWSQAFGINRIGVHDSFYDLGGDSLIASRIVSAIARIFPWELTMAEFYDTYTIEAIAKLLMQKAPTQEGADKVAALYLQVTAMSTVEVEEFLAKERNKRQPDERPNASKKD